MSLQDAPNEQEVDLSEFQVPMHNIPGRVTRAIAAGVLAGDDMPFSDACEMLNAPHDQQIDRVQRNKDGVLVVCCHTDMPGVTPQMWDWWFGWHLPSTTRYRLWHPKDHVRARIHFDNSAARKHNSRYVGQVSMVDEYISGKMQKLTIAFHPPKRFGLDPIEVKRQGVAICARTGLRGTPVDAGYLIHLVRKTPTGSEMLSRFWLGELAFSVPILGAIVTPLLNTKPARRALVPDEMGLALLRHCSEEMNHLARLLPGLYGKFGNI